MAYPVETYIKDPKATLDYGIDWGTHWLGTGDSISVSEWSAPTGLTIDSELLSGSTASVRLSGGTLGESYLVVNRVTTATGLVDERTICIRIAER